MPKQRYYKRYSTKKKWASHLYNFNSSANADFLNVELCKNADTVSVPIPSLIKCGNFKVNLGIRLTMTQATNLGFDMTLAVVFMPEGVTVTNGAQIQDVLIKHPEWVMAIKYKSFKPEATSAMNIGNIDLSSRLKRNLNTGDRIMLLGATNGTQVASIGVGGVVRYWTRYN